MNTLDLMEGLSQLDEELVMEPRKYVSGRMNLLLCLLAANFNRMLPFRKDVWSIVTYFLLFGLMYVCVCLWINRKKCRKLLIEKKTES